MSIDWLVPIALAGILVVVIIGAIVIMRTPEDNNTQTDTRKIRFAAATFTGILMLHVLTATMFFVSGRDSSDQTMPSNAEKIFDKTISALTPLAGVIVGYLFGVRTGPKKDDGGV